jgi:ankyrin repeat protein
MKNRFLQETKNNFSSSDSKSSMGMQGGAINDLIFGSKTGEYMTKLILDAFGKNQVAVGAFILNHADQNNIEPKFGIQDSEGKTLLHWLVIYSQNLPELKEKILKAFEKWNAKKYVNKQDNKKNTAAHYAMYLDMSDIINLLREKGADLTLKNDAGLSIGVEDKFEKPNCMQSQNQRKPNVFMKKNHDDNSDMNDSVDDIRRAIGNLVNSRVNRTDEETINFSDGVPFAETNADSAAKRKPFVLTAKKTQDEMELDKIMRNINMNGVNTDNSANSHEIVNSFIQDYDKKNKQEMAGGSKLMTGTRRMNTYSEISMSGGDDASSSTSCDTEDEDCESSSDDEDDDDDDDDDLLYGGKYASGPFRGLTVSEVDELAGLNRLKNLNRSGGAKNDRQEDDRHEEAIKRIMKILDVDDATARAYKAIIYRRIKEENADMKYADRVLELEKQSADKKILESISKKDVDTMKNQLEIIRKERESRIKNESKAPKEEKEEKPKKETKAKKTKSKSKESKYSATSSSYM